VGLITYMRTDGVQVTPEALDETRRFIGKRYGAEYVPESARIYKTKAATPRRRTRRSARRRSTATRRACTSSPTSSASMN
jgi:hypothetical protein